MACRDPSIVACTRHGEKADGVSLSQVLYPKPPMHIADAKGNVQVDQKHLATPHDRFIPDSSAATIASYARLHQSTVSSAPTGQAPLTLVQISHPGLQASAVVSMARAPWSRSVAPISARPDLGNGWLAWILAHAFWPIKSRPLVRDEWMAVVGKFVRAAKVIEQAGWGGVQIHSAHGYLLAEYLSPHVRSLHILCRPNKY